MGPLRGIKIIELAGLGPAPFAGMMLADMGAEVVRVERPSRNSNAPLDPLARNRKSIACNLKHPGAIEAVLRLVDGADGLIEGFRPGVTERLGLGPEVCLARNPGLVYGRMTGWGQDGPLAHAAGHDMNYLALTGMLNMIGERGRKPVPPLNLVADFGGGGMLLAFGMVCAILSARVTGKGQVVDAAMVDGVNAMASLFHGFRAMGVLAEGTGESFLGGAAHWYDTYETRDGRYVAIASLEPQYYELLIDLAGLDRERFEPHGFHWMAGEVLDEHWPELKAELAAVFRTKTRDEWCEIMEGTDVCFAPVLTLSEALEHPHNTARTAFVDVGGSPQPSPAPRFGETAPDTPLPGVLPGKHSREILLAAGYSSDEADGLILSGAVSQCE
jgi:alpha-methylacyl-CoA racemase